MGRARRSRLPSAADGGCGGLRGNLGRVTRAGGRWPELLLGCWVSRLPAGVRGRGSRLVFVGFLGERARRRNEARGRLAGSRSTTGWRECPLPLSLALGGGEIDPRDWESGTASGRDAGRAGRGGGRRGTGEEGDRVARARGPPSPWAIYRWAYLCASVVHPARRPSWWTRTKYCSFFLFLSFVVVVTRICMLYVVACFGCPKIEL
jgi:hypothetical protein